MTKKISRDTQLLESNNSIIADLRNDCWIYNPVVYSQISGDFSLWQQRILIGIVEQLQQRILNSIAEQKVTKAFADIFDAEELKGMDNIELQIPLRDLGVDSKDYGKLEQAGAALIGIHMRIPNFDATGKRVRSTTHFNLFNSIEIPNVEYTKDGHLVKGRRMSYLRVVMSKENIRNIFSLRQGYIKHLSQIALLAQKKRTPRIYILLSRYKEMGHKMVPYNDLLEYLGLTDEFYFQTNNGTAMGSKGGTPKGSVAGKTVNPFSEWNRVRSQVLLPVQKEMKDLADSGQIDICFDFEPIHAHGKKRGTPQYIKFTIMKSTFGEQCQEYDRRRSMIHKWVDNYIKWCPDLSEFDLVQLTNDLSDEKLKEFIAYAHKDVRKLVEKVQPDNVAAYALTCLRRWKQQQHQRDLFSEVEAQEAEERQRKVEEEARANSIDVDAGREQWQQLLQRCSAEYKAHLLKATYIGMKRGYPLIQFNMQQELDAFNEFENTNTQQERVFTKLRNEIYGAAGRVLIRGVKGK